MAEQSEIQTAATPTNGNTLSLPNNSNSDPTWNYTWDEKLCKTTLKLFTPTVYTPPILPLPDIRDPKRHYVCPVEGCKKTFNRESRSQFRVHLKRHLPDSEKPFKCDEPTCTRAFVRIDELTIHKRTHTGEKPYECEQCGKKFTRNHHLYKHLGTHIKKTKISAETSIEVSSKEVGGDDSDAESDNSSKDLDVPVKQEIDTETDADTDAETDVDDYLHDMEEIKVEPENITEPFIPAFYSYDQRVHINEAKMQEIGNGAGDISNASNNFKSNDTSSSSLAPIKMEVPVKKDIYRDKYDIPIKLEVPVKQEIDTEATYEYDHRFEEYDQCITRNIKNQPGMVAESYCPEFYSSREPPSMTHAIHRLAFPTPITTTDIKSLSNPTNNIDSESLQAAINLLDFPIPISANNIKSESNPTNIESEYKPIEKPYKCSVEGCDRAFKVPYGLKRHSWVHTKVKTFECDKCMKKFLRKDHLSKHMKTHSRIPIIKYPKGLAE